MPPAVSALASRFAGVDRFCRHSAWRAGLIALPHILALAVLLLTENNIVSQAVFVLTWGMFYCLWLALLRRPVLAGAVSLSWLVLLVLLSQLKHSVLFMTVNFVDLMIIDWDTIGFLLTVIPGLGRNVLIAALVTLPAMAAIWWLDPVRVRMRTAATGSFVCFAGLAGVATAVPSNSDNEFYSGQYLSKFARSGVTAIGDYLVRGLMESDSRIVERLKPVAEAS